MQDRPVLQSHIPDAQTQVAARALPGMQPVGAKDWLTIDDAYSGQLDVKRKLIAENRPDVLQQLEGTDEPLQELLDAVLDILRARLDFDVQDDIVIRPDGAHASIDRNAPLLTLSQLIQEDLCLHQKQGEEHQLRAALLCFPASWSLAEKIGRPLSAIHEPVEEYDEKIAARVQRLFDGLQPNQPIWRANSLYYDEATLFQPRRESFRRRRPGETAPFVRAERQTLIRLPKSGAIVFAIHTSVVASAPSA